MVEALETVLATTGIDRSAVRAVGLDTPGPASADGVISSRGATNFSDPEWWGFDVRGALEARLGLPVVYNNDGNAAALYAHHEHFGTALDPVLLGRSDRGHRPRWRRRRAGPGRARCSGHGR